MTKITIFFIFIYVSFMVGGQEEVMAINFLPLVPILDNDVFCVMLDGNN